MFKILSRVCCENQKKFDKQTPGFFKIEWSGTELVCLNSKTFCACNQNNDTLKMVTKGNDNLDFGPIGRRRFGSEKLSWFLRYNFWFVQFCVFFPLKQNEIGKKIRFAHKLI